jgi:hypothetical protein
MQDGLVLPSPGEYVKTTLQVETCSSCDDAPSQPEPLRSFGCAQDDRANETQIAPSRQAERREASG